MKENIQNIGGYDIKVVSLNTVVVGTGAAGFNAADCLFQNGQKDIAIVTEHIKAGTSRNTGSDKQTYYKLSLSGDTPDSVRALAEVLYSGQCVDGDIALCEAALSAQGFYKLVGLGVPFPKNCFGEYVGYKTDHDPSKRATSVGPYTSKIMTECLEKSVNEKQIKIYDKHQIIRILTDKNKERVLGLLCLNISNLEEEMKEPKYTIFNCKNIIYATGGPAGMYADSVYPYGHYGTSGLAFEAGVKGKNLTEWQYGLASIKPRWNVSGTYMQVLPRFISTDEDGSNPKEFLFDFFKDKGEMLLKVFLKGYQWPFDVRKIDGGSSIIDVLVYIESCMNGRRIFLDFRENPAGEAINFEAMELEAKEYLEKAGACFGTPLERLRHINQPAVEFYMDRGVDLSKEMLEIALCAQHNNGGLVIDKWWQTNIKGFFAVGEVSASHGVYRPGGSALNAGQVGAARAAEYISARCQGEPEALNCILEHATQEILSTIAMGENIKLQSDNTEDTLDVYEVEELWTRATKRMSRIGAAIREEKNIAEAINEVQDEISMFESKITISDKSKIRKVYRLHDMLLSQFVYLNAMKNYIEKGGKSRGSALYTSKDGVIPYEQLPEIIRFELDVSELADQIQEIKLHGITCTCDWRVIREIPKTDDFFENVWRSYRENRNIDR